MVKELSSTILDKKEETACQEFVLNGGDQSKSFRKAYPQSSRWKDKTVHEKASRFFSQDKIKARVAELRLEAAEIANEQFKVDASYVLGRLVEIDQMDVADILDDAGNMLPVREWPKCWRQTISGLDVNEILSGDVATVIKKIKWPDKVKNLELIGKHVDVQAFKDQVGLSGSLKMDDLTDEQLEARIAALEKQAG